MAQLLTSRTGEWDQNQASPWCPFGHKEEESEEGGENCGFITC